MKTVTNEDRDLRQWCRHRKAISLAAEVPSLIGIAYGGQTAWVDREQLRRVVIAQPTIGVKAAIAAALQAAAATPSGGHASGDREAGGGGLAAAAESPSGAAGAELLTPTSTRPADVPSGDRSPVGTGRPNETAAGDVAALRCCISPPRTADARQSAQPIGASEIARHTRATAAPAARRRAVPRVSAARPSRVVLGRFETRFEAQNVTVSCYGVLTDAAPSTEGR